MNYLDLFNNITDFARKSNDIKAMILFGSRCRSENVADEWSDYDLMFFVDNPDSFIYKDEWLEEIGNVKISFVQPIVPQNLERRIIFEDGTDVDFIFYDVKDSRKILENETILLWFSRGFNILVDKCNC
ncbi:MAG: aminoglycoside 6-adenylyltransferase, partial [Treponema sp.]|nr:aminoglycoside 6-adenylyltransferase [Treponema sp.]